MDNFKPSKLTIISGGLQPNQSFVLSQIETTIGRIQPVDILIEDPIVSRQHARITLQGEQYFLEDLGSSNGTFLNGQPVVGRTALTPGDKVSLGHKIILVFEAPPKNLETMLEGFDMGQSPLETRLETGLPTPPPPIQTPVNLTPPELKAPPELHAPPVTQAPSVDQTPPVLKAPPVTPPKQPDAPSCTLVVRVSGAAPSTHLLHGERLTLGRAEDNDIVIASKVISRHHARFERHGDSYRVHLLPDATNPLVMAGELLPDGHILQDGDVIHIGSNLADMAVSLSFQSSSPVIETSVSAASPIKAAPAEKARPDMTVMDANLPIQVPASAIPPRLIVNLVGQEPLSYPLQGEHIRLGRAEDNDIVIPSMIVSRHHATLERVPGGYEIVVSSDATNILSCQGRPVTQRQRLHHGDVLRIDSDQPGMMVSMSYQAPAEAEAAAQVQSIDFSAKEKLAFGRDAANDVVLDLPTVSRFHAQVERVGRRFAVTDLRSANGTFVNDERIEGRVWLKAQDTIRIGSYRFVVGDEQFVRYDDTSGLRVEAAGVNKWVRKNLNILQNISLVFQPREFIVVVGQSGGGKSTLVDAIAGYRPATHGKVLVNGIDVYKNFDAIRNEIGYVPQRDIIHMELTVYQALDYAAQLRMPRDTSKAERHKRIIEVLEDLDLAHRKDNQISSLSGGQQKRVSIGVELLTRPGLFFLDEPTSGLDPGTETAFMHLCRRLADQGRTIIMVTHATKNVMLADKVVFLARGGYLAWFGPPDEALEYFDQYRSERERRARPMEFDQIYAILDDASKGKAIDWAKRFQEHQAYRTYITQALQSSASSLPLVAQAGAQATAQAKPAKRRARKNAQISSLRQFFILSSRNIKILTRDRSSLILMVLIAPLVGMLDLVIAPLMGRSAFDFNTGDAPNAAITLFLLTIYCLLVGGLSQMREFVKEGEIYKRERLVNLRIFPYVTSKVWVALLLAFYQGLAYTIIHYIAFDMPGGRLEFGLFYVTTVLAVMAGMVGGLLASALSPAASSAPMIMILLIVPQIVLSGALAPVPTNVSSIASTRWALQGYVGITGIGSDIAADACYQLPKELRDDMTLEMKEYFGCRCL